ncbi:MAG: hypothetical protein MH825_10655 [Cyanobacteria bacterium]|nr:hypothetical protein [Cyanobacteriota bacterium]
MRDETASPFDSVPPSPPRGAASVPIAVYYQLAEELRGLKAQLAAATEHNAALAAQNQQLREQLEGLVAAAMQVKTQAPQTATVPPVAPAIASPQPKTPAPSAIAPPLPERPLPLPATGGGPLGSVAPLNLTPDSTPFGGKPELQDLADWNALPAFDEPRFSEQPVNPFPDGPSDRAKAPAGNWWTVVAIAAIGAMAFGVSFAIVRPLTQGQR